MELRPILSAMRRNKVGAILIGVQMAITLAILCNALFIIEQRVALSTRPTGTDESNIFVINKIAPDIGLKDIIWGTLPFVLLMMVAIVILCVFPWIAMALPNLVYNK